MDVTASVISLLGVAINSFNFMQLAQEFEDDFAIYQLQLDMLQVRLSRWGQAAGIVPASGNNEQLPQGMVNSNSALGSEQDVDKIQSILEEIESTIERAQRKAKEKLKTLDPRSRQPLDPETHMPRGMNRIRANARQFLRRRGVQAVKVADGLKWAFYEKESLNDFVGNMSRLVGDLENLIPEDKRQRLRDLSQEECKGMNKPNLEDVKEIAENCDPWLEKSAEETLKSASNGGTYITVSGGTGNVAGIHNGNNTTTTNNNYWGRV